MRAVLVVTDMCAPGVVATSSSGVGTAHRTGDVAAIGLGARLAGAGSRVTGGSRWVTPTPLGRFTPSRPGPVGATLQTRPGCARRGGGPAVSLSPDSWS